MARYFVTSSGAYIGAFDVPDEALTALLPPGAIEVPEPPQDARQTWQDGAWSAVPPQPYVIAKSTATRRILAAGKAVEVNALLTDPANLEHRLLWDSISEIRSDHPDTAILRQQLATIPGLDVDAVLAPEE